MTMTQAQTNRRNESEVALFAIESAQNKAYSLAEELIELWVEFGYLKPTLETISLGVANIERQLMTQTIMTKKEIYHVMAEIHALIKNIYDQLKVIKGKDTIRSRIEASYKVYDWFDDFKFTSPQKIVKWKLDN